MTDELPKCRLCGQEPTHLSGGRVSHICVTPEDEWRRLHGPRLAQAAKPAGQAVRELPNADVTGLAPAQENEK